MEPSTKKTCLACREEIDAAAIVCPHCRSSAAYDLWSEVGPANVEKKEKARRVIYSLSSIPATISGLIGFLVGGFWTAVVAFVIAGAITTAIGFWLAGNRAKDVVRLACPKCGDEWIIPLNEEYTKPGQLQGVRCAKCRSSVMLRFVDR
jgi:predicted RNA-binding Zn-ribbon protein involved in translation (DUF1610 family)